MDIAAAYAEAGVTEIVALRGDPPKAADRFVPHPDGFASSVELIAALAVTGKFVARQPPCPVPTTTLAGFEAAGVGVFFGFPG